MGTLTDAKSNDAQPAQRIIGMKSFWLVILIYLVFGIGPILNIWFGVPLVALVWFYFGVVLGQPIGALALKVQQESEARKRRQ